MKQLMILFFLTVLMSQAMAGQDRGGGGVLKCSSKRAIVFDYFEASFPTVSGRKPRLLDVEPPDFFDTMIKRLKSLSDRKEREYRQKWDEKVSNAVSSVGKVDDWKATNLNVVPDVNAVFPIPSGCNYLQAAVQVQGRVFGDPAVISTLSSGQAQVLRFHEVLKFMFLEAGISTSDGIRLGLAELLDYEFQDDRQQKASQYIVDSIERANAKYYCSISCELPWIPNEIAQISRFAQNKELALALAIKDCTNETWPEIVYGRTYTKRGMSCGRFDGQKNCILAPSIDLNCNNP